ncbi:MAG: leucine-rich repeat domain-containing protein [Clostridia bacterium]|nr:leucine-rich repeat domain-containing protein [Clostridia bacterium]
MELEELIGKIYKESEKNVPDVRDKVITRAKAEGLLELTPSSETVTYGNGKAASLAMRKKGWIAGIASAIVVAVVCLVIGLAIILRGGPVIPPVLDKVKSEKDISEDYAAGIVSTARLMNNFVPDGSAEIKPARGAAAAKAAVTQNQIGYFDNYLDAFGAFYGEDLVNASDKAPFASDKYDTKITIGGQLANGDKVAYDFYYSEYKDLAKSTGGNEYYYLEGGISIKYIVRESFSVWHEVERQFTVLGERTYAAGASAESALKMCVYPDIDDKSTYGKMELEFAADGADNLKKYAYTVVKGGKTVSEAKAHKPATGGDAFILEMKGGNGEEGGTFNIGNPTGEGIFTVNFNIGGLSGAFSAVQTSEKKYKSVLYGQFTFELRDDGTCLVTGVDKRVIIPEDIVIPDTCDGYKVVGIKQSAFYYNNDIKSVVIPESVTQIGKSAFASCRSLERVELPSGLDKIEEYVFENCSKLSEINLPENTEAIGKYAFAGCNSLENIVFPEKLKSIDAYAFQSCSNLKAAAIPANVSSIGNGVFSYCSALEALTVDGANGVYKGINNCIINTAEKTLVAGCKTSIIPADGKVLSIGKYAFAGMDGLLQITLPECLEKIDDSAFISSGLTQISIPDKVSVIQSSAFAYCADLISVNIYDSSRLQYIGHWAFQNCTMLASMYIPADVQQVYADAFYRCDRLMSLTVHGNNQYLRSEGNCIIERSTDCLWVGCNGSVIPADGSITEIGREAFKGRINLIRAEIPAVRIIGDEAFAECWGLVEVSIEYGTGAIGQSAFAFCSFENIVIPDSVTQIMAGAFENNSYLREVKLPYYIEVIEVCVFRNCSNLYNVSMGDNIRVIGASAFENCERLSIEIPGNVWEIGFNAFYNCGLTSVRIPSGVNDNLYPEVQINNIAEGAFKHCIYLNYVYIPANIEIIGNQAFYGCEELEKITYEGTMEEWNNIIKGDGWNYGAEKYVVECSDGTLDKDGNIVNP